MTQSYRESHLYRGHDYDEGWSTIPHRAMMWRLEQRALDRVFKTLGAKRLNAYLDFACGTGRMLGFFGKYAQTITGVDVSPSMLDVARARAPSAELILGDITREPLLGARRFEVISAFRFFPNAEPELRRDAMAELVRHLDPKGILVFNNHRNPDSLFHRTLKLLGRWEPDPPGTRRMMHSEVAAMVAEAGLRIVRAIPLGILPMEEGYFYGPPAAVEMAERVLSRLPLVRPLALNTIYVCRHA